MNSSVNPVSVNPVTPIVLIENKSHLKISCNPKFSITGSLLLRLIKAYFVREAYLYRALMGHNVVQELGSLVPG